jgi:hypothetical protein
MLEQWLYLGRAIFSELASEEAITSTIEFVRFVGMCGVTGLDTLMAERMKAIIIADPALPSEGTIRCILATAAVERYLRSQAPEGDSRSSQLFS